MAMTDTARSDPTDIFMWQRIHDRLTTSGQPTEDQLQRIRALGVTHVVNLGLHSHEKALPDEPRIVFHLGMRYFHIPVDFNCPTQEDFESFRVVMRDLDDTVVHVHCIANLRVSAFLYRYLRDDLAVPEHGARRHLEAIWRPGGVWASFVGDEAASGFSHRYAGRDY
jgi:protein tyrosine phosphatase (PTP) superfamily phosphohydrolase (DUF442 family)